jgi:hypothetical protein
VHRRVWIGLVAIVLAVGLAFSAIILAVLESQQSTQAPSEELRRQLTELDHIKESLGRLAAFIDAEAAAIR